MQMNKYGIANCGKYYEHVQSKMRENKGEVGEISIVRMIQRKALRE